MKSGVLAVKRRGDKKKIIIEYQKSLLKK